MNSFPSQFTDISESLQYSLQRSAGRLERFTAQLNFARQLCAAHPDRAQEWQERIVAAGRVVQQGLKGESVHLGDLIARGEEILQPIGQVAKTYTLLCVSHAHIDMNWMWSWPETVAVTHDTFQTMLALMDEFPGFIYSQSQASTYHMIEKYDPPMFEAIRQRVREGRWEVTASQWVEGDKNMSSGESISRHLLYTREYFQTKFGLSPEDVQVDFEPDTFGHPATLPTILARGGVKYYYHCRGSHGPHLYWWAGPDGSRVLAFNDVQWYMCAIAPQIADPLVEYALSTGMRAMPVLYGVGDHGGGPTRRDLRRLMAMNDWPVFPRLEFSTLHSFFRRAESTSLQEAQRVPEIAGERNFVFTGCYTSQARQKWANRHGENLLFAAEAAATLGSRLAGVAYPQENLEEAWKHLLFDQFHDILPGSGVRETRHYALARAQESQAAASMARTNALRALAARVDTDSLRSKLVGAFQEGTERAYKDEVESALSMGAGVGYAAGTGGESAASVSQASDRAFLVFNPLPYERTEVVEVKLWDTQLDLERLVVTGSGTTDGEIHDTQRVQVLQREERYWGHTATTIAFPVRVPALGYRAVCISDRLAELGLAADEVQDPWAGTMGAWRKIPPPDHTLENEFLRVRLDPASGSIASLLDKRSGREWAPGRGEAPYSPSQGEAPYSPSRGEAPTRPLTPTAILQYCVEQNVGMSAWVIGPFLKRVDLLDGGSLQRVHSGPYVQTFRWRCDAPGFGALHLGAGEGREGTRLELDITLRQGTPRVEFLLRVDWREIGHPQRGIPHLRVRFPLAICDPQGRYEIPFGAIRRDLFDGQEVPALRWADLSEADGQGVTLANASRYGFSVEGNALNMTLLRASIEPDPLPDLGEHTISYALVPHGEGWTVGDCMRVGEEMNVPLVVASCGFCPPRPVRSGPDLTGPGRLPGGSLPAAMSTLAIEDRNVRLAALKQSQDGAALILRLVEVEGRETEARVTLAPELLPAGAAAVEVDTLERPLEVNGARLEGNTLAVRLPAFGMATVRVG